MAHKQNGTSSNSGELNICLAKCCFRHNHEEIEKYEAFTETSSKQQKLLGAIFFVWSFIEIFSKCFGAILYLFYHSINSYDAESKIQASKYHLASPWPMLLVFVFESDCVNCDAFRFCEFNPKNFFHARPTHHWRSKPSELDEENIRPFRMKCMIFFPFILFPFSLLSFTIFRSFPIRCGPVQRTFDDRHQH